MTSQSWSAEMALWLVAILPALVGAGLCLAGRRIERNAVAISLATAAAVTALAVVVAVARPVVSTPFVAQTPFELAVDGLSAVVLVTVAVITLLVLVFAAADVTQARARFHGLMLLFAAAVVVTATATNLVTLLVAWEVMGAASYALVGFAWRQPLKVEAGAVAFLTTRAADLGLYVAAGAALAGGAGLKLGQLVGADPGWRHVIAAGVLVAALGKAAQLPFSFWLSRAMAGPSPVSALLHSAAMVAMGGYLLLRTSDLLQVTGWAAMAAAWVGVLTALLLGVVALGQNDLKQLLAASTSAQLGFVVLAAGVGAVAGGTAHFVAHAVTKALLFVAAGAWLTALGTKRLSTLQGVGRRWPPVGAAAAVGALALAGVAPLSLWATKDGILAAAFERSAALYVVGLAATGVSAAYAGKLLFIIYGRTPVDDGGEEGIDEEQRGTRRVAPTARIVVLLLAIGAATLGALALPPFGDQFRQLLGVTKTKTATVWELLASAAVVLVVLAVMALRGRGSPLLRPRWAESWLGLERATRLLLVAPTMGLARALARFDDRVLDRGVDGSSRLTRRLADRLSAVDVGGVDGVVEGVGRATRWLGDLARRPQTGQLHEYYVQATALLAVGVVVLILIG
ncbi:MAG: NADH-quinone oxidoreductase subunit L [Actinomycetota bacterium]|nr:NADH-quinone oxidoreductase subunit L [Actinomycetota bacterium]